MINPRLWVKCKMKHTCLFASNRAATLFTLPANSVLLEWATIPTLKLDNGSSPTSGCVGDDVTENGAGLSDGEPEPLDDGSCVRIEPSKRVECRSASACASLVAIDLNTNRDQFITLIIGVNNNLFHTFPVSFFDIEFCIARAETPLGKSQTLICSEEHREQIACRRTHENLYIGTIRMQQGTFETESQSTVRLPRGDTNRESRDIRISSSSELRSRSSGVSM
jgi:hypothetical protein